MVFDCLICSLRNLGRKKLRSALTVSGIAIGVASVILIGSIGRQGKSAIQEELGSLGLGSVSISADQRFTNLRMDEQDLQLLRELPVVESVSPVVMEYSTVRMRGLVANTMLWGIENGEESIISLTPKHGRMLMQEDLTSAADVCVIDSNTAKLFYNRENVVGKRLEALIGGSYVGLEIVGVVNSGGSILQNMVGDVIPAFVYLPYTTLQRYKGERYFEQLAITLRESAPEEATIQQLESLINRQHNLSRGFKADNIAKQKDALDRTLQIITWILSAIAAISLVVAGLGIMTVMTVSVNERTHEIGIKKSIGATNNTILVEFLIEAFTISLIGSMIGVVIGLAGVSVGCFLMHWPFQPDWDIIRNSLAISVCAGVIFGVYPAAMAARMRPVDALRTD